MRYRRFTPLWLVYTCICPCFCTLHQCFYTFVEIPINDLLYSSNLFIYLMHSVVFQTRKDWNMFYVCQCSKTARSINKTSQKLYNSALWFYWYIYTMCRELLYRTEGSRWNWRKDSARDGSATVPARARPYQRLGSVSPLTCSSYNTRAYILYMFYVLYGSILYDVILR